VAISNITREGQTAVFNSGFLLLGDGAMPTFPKKILKKTQLASSSWGRCYDHNFLRFSPIYGDKIGEFLKKQCYDHFFQ
jgi:hypothetical protein